MEIFNSVSGVLITLTTFFGLGWASHAFYHRREHYDLKSQVKKLDSNKAKKIKN